MISLAHKSRSVTARLHRHSRRWNRAMQRTRDCPIFELSRTAQRPRMPRQPRMRALYARILGVDLVAVMGLSASSVQTIISEIGTDMSKFPTVKHFGSWLGLAPHNDISGGKVLRSRTMKVRSRANQAFRDAAASVTRAHSFIG